MSEITTTMTQNEPGQNPSAEIHPPVEKKPDPQPVPVYPLSSEAPKSKGRRVGTITMACALIATGVLILIGTVNPSVSILMAARLAPIILIVLGVEILVRYAFSKGEKLRYDFLSAFICFCLVIGSLCVAALPEVWRNFGPHKSTLENALGTEANRTFARSLADDGVVEVNTFVDLNRTNMPEEMTLADLKSTDRVYCDLRLSGHFPDVKSFAQKARQVLEKLDGQGIDLFRVSVNAPSKDGLYNYNLSFDCSGMGVALSADRIEELTTVYYAYGENEGYDEMQRFAETFFAEFDRFVTEFQPSLPEEYPARVHAFASYYEEQFQNFLYGGEIVFPHREESPIEESPIGEIPSEEITQQGETEDLPDEPKVVG